jgi:membrane protein implicated in regulation of membrane protease activity
MCHLILVLPLAALPLLWLLPAGVSIPLYAAALVAAAWAYWLALRAMRAPVTTGVEALLHAVGTVRSLDGRRAAICLGSELWFTQPSVDPLAVGDRVEVLGMEGLQLKVRRIDGTSTFAGSRVRAALSPGTGG